MDEATRHDSAARVSEGDRIPWAWVVGTAVGLEVAITASAVAWIVIYSYLIHPGEAESYYQNYARSASPVVSILLGIPYWFFACRWVGRKAGSRAIVMSVWICVIILVIDLSLILLLADPETKWTIIAVSHSTKLIAAYSGGRAALKRVS